MKRPDGRPDPYAALGVRRGATLEEVKTVYYALMLETHPDRLVGADPETLARAESEARRFNEAWAEIKSLDQARGPGGAGATTARAHDFQGPTDAPGAMSLAERAVEDAASILERLRPEADGLLKAPPALTASLAAIERHAAIVLGQRQKAAPIEPGVKARLRASLEDGVFVQLRAALTEVLRQRQTGASGKRFTAAHEAASNLAAKVVRELPGRRQQVYSATLEGLKALDAIVRVAAGPARDAQSARERAQVQGRTSRLALERLTQGSASVQVALDRATVAVARATALVESEGLGIDPVARTAWMARVARCTDALSMLNREASRLSPSTARPLVDEIALKVAAIVARVERVDQDAGALTADVAALRALRDGGLDANLNALIVSLDGVLNPKGPETTSG